MAAAEHIQAAERLLRKNGYSDIPEPQRREADIRARIGIAAALDALAPTQPIPVDPPATGVTARIVTAYGLRFNDLRASVDIVEEHAGGGRYKVRAICRPCAQQIAEESRPCRGDALDAAAGHARSCMAMPQLNDEEAV